ncbi:MAG: N-acyl homoserine lactonase family protein [Acidimicrobiia bacterium]|nr:N-acyl homoserine lactonase family protein [Acidimicrobiia bacterium]
MAPTTVTSGPVEPPADHLPRHEIYALKYAERSARRPEHFLGGDPHDEPMDMDYFVWAIVGPDATWVVDTGFDTLDAERRSRTLVRSVADALASVDVAATKVDDVILTHLHYDHVGGFAQFPAARFHLQDDEMSYATGRHMAQPAIGHAYTADHIADLVHLVHGGRVVFHDGDTDLAPGISVHLVGGHTEGLQVVRVSTAIGWVVLASDASHYYENMRSGRPFPIVYHLGDMLEGHRRCFELASSPEYVVPGHDPRVFDRYPPARPGLEGIAARLDLEPTPP